MVDSLANILKERSLTISVAESCTGGLIGHTLTNEPGSSDYFLGGVVSYSNQSKVDLLGVSTETIREHGAVSNKTAKEMASGVRQRFGTDIGLSVTGIAGPDGGTDEKPVGTVFMGLSFEDKIFSQEYRFKGTREEIKQECANMALELVKRYLNDDPLLPGL
jgi:nicotinamide-nucleotide amidase